MLQDKPTKENDSDISDIVCLDSSTSEEEEEEDEDEEEEAEAEEEELGVEKENVDTPKLQMEGYIEDVEHKETNLDMMVEDEDVSDNDSSEEEVDVKPELRQSSTSFKHRFTVPSSEESSCDSFVMKDVARPGVSGYSKVESDFSSESDAGVVDGFVKEDEPEATSDAKAENADPVPTEYSKVVSDSESEDEVCAEDKDKLGQENEPEVASGAGVENADSLPVECGKNGSHFESETVAGATKPEADSAKEEEMTEAKEDEDEEMEEEEEEEEEEEFELKFTETPTAVSRRTTRQRFSLSSAASSDGDVPCVKDVEASPVLDPKEENEETHSSVSDEGIDREPVDRSSNRFSMFKVLYL